MLGQGKRTTVNLSIAAFIKSRWLDGAGDDVREGVADIGALTSLKFCDTEPRPRPRPRALVLDGENDPRLLAGVPRPARGLIGASLIVRGFRISYLPQV